MNAIVEVVRVYEGSDGEATKALYAKLQKLSPFGPLCVNLFRVQKNSERAKVYRGRGYRGAAYDRKDWSIGNLVRILAQQKEISWGWGVDEKQSIHRDVLYVDLPTGQVSFHTNRRLEGPDYQGQWDGQPGQSPQRIIRWVSKVLEDQG